MKNKIILKVQNYIYLIIPDQILYCEADDCYTSVFTDEKTIVISQSLTKFSKGLPPEIFVRISQSLLVNAHYITEIDKKKKTLSLENGAKLHFTVTLKKLVEMLPTSFTFMEQSA